MLKCFILVVSLWGIEMECPKCGSKWGVTNTASGGNYARDNILNHGRKLVGWFCDDFVIRIRKCTNSECGHRQYTIEIIIDDAKEIFDILCKEGFSALKIERKR